MVSSQPPFPRIGNCYGAGLGSVSWEKGGRYWSKLGLIIGGGYDLHYDWDNPRYTSDEVAAWNGPSCLFVIPTRRPPFMDGGNRPGFLDPSNFFAGRLFWRIGVHSEQTLDDCVRRLLASGYFASVQATIDPDVEQAEHAKPHKSLPKK